MKKVSRLDHHRALKKRKKSHSIPRGAEKEREKKRSPVLPSAPPAGMTWASQGQCHRKRGKRKKKKKKELFPISFPLITVLFKHCPDRGGKKGKEGSKKLRNQSARLPSRARAARRSRAGQKEKEEGKKKVLLLTSHLTQPSLPLRP